MVDVEKIFNSENFNFFQAIIPNYGTPKTLLYYRLIAFVILIYGFVCSIYAEIYTNTKKIYLAFFTNQTYIGILIYFMVNIYLHHKYQNGTLLGRVNNSTLHTLIHIFYNVQFPLACIVTAVFWSLIFPQIDTSEYNILNYSQQIIQHLCNSIIVGIDWFLITIPTSKYHFFPMFIVGVAYLIFALIFHSITDIWIYNFLDTKHSYWIGLYIALILVWSILGFVFAWLQNFKNRNRKYITEEDNAAKEFIGLDQV